MKALRNERIHGYILHSRAYREKSRLVHFYSLEYGRIDGVMRQTPPPLYQPCSALISGKNALKTFHQVEAAGSVLTLKHSALIAGFYLNELMVKLLPLEDASPTLFAAYTCALNALSTLASNDILALKLMLRAFEHQLLDSLGYSIRFDMDTHQNKIMPDSYYRYQFGEGFIAQPQAKGEKGAVLLSMLDANTAYSAVTEPMLSRIFKMMINTLLDFKPLKSRELWMTHHAVSKHSH